MREIPGTPVHSSACTPRGFPMFTPLVTSSGVNAPGGTASPGALVEPSPSILRRTRWRIALRLSWEGRLPTSRDGSGKPPSFGRGGLAESKGSLILIRRRCLLKKRLLLRSYRNDCHWPSYITLLPEAMACTTRCCLALYTMLKLRFHSRFIYVGVDISIYALLTGGRS